MKRAKVTLFSLVFSLVFSGFASAEMVRTYTDLDLNSPYAPAIQYTSLDIFDGYEDGSFRGDSPVNRAELAKIIVEGTGVTPNSSQYKNCFSDVKEEWFAPYVCYGKTQGWWSGYSDGTFAPANSVLKVEAVKMMWTSQGLVGDSTMELPYADTDAGSWYLEYLEPSYSKNFLEETGPYYSPAEAMSREKIAELLFRYLSTSEASEDSYNVNAYDHAMEQAGLEEDFGKSDQSLYVARSYNLDDSGNIEVMDYELDADGYVSTSTYLEGAGLAICENPELKEDRIYADLSECELLSDYDIRQTGESSVLAIYGFNDSGEFESDENGNFIPDWADDEGYGESIWEYLEYIENSNDSPDDTSDPISNENIDEALESMVAEGNQSKEACLEILENTLTYDPFASTGTENVDCSISGFKGYVEELLETHADDETSTSSSEGYLILDSSKKSRYEFGLLRLTATYSNEVAESYGFGSVAYDYLILVGVTASGEYFYSAESLNSFSDTHYFTSTNSPLSSTEVSDMTWSGYDALVGYIQEDGLFTLTISDTYLDEFLELNTTETTTSETYNSEGEILDSDSSERSLSVSLKNYFNLEQGDAIQWSDNGIEYVLDESYEQESNEVLYEYTDVTTWSITPLN